MSEREQEYIVSFKSNRQKLFGVGRAILWDEQCMQVWVPTFCVPQSIRDDLGYTNSQDKQWLIAYVPKIDPDFEIVHALTSHDRESYSDYSLLSQFYPQHFAGVVTYWNRSLC